MIRTPRRHSHLSLRSTLMLLALATLLSVSSGALAQDENREYKPKDPEEIRREKEEKEKREGSWTMIKKITLKPDKVQSKTLVGWQKGRVRRFRFEILQRPVVIQEVEVHYGKGAVDLYEIDETIGVGEYSGAFPVDKDKKLYIRKIYIRYMIPDPEEGGSEKDFEAAAVIRLLGNRK